MYIYTVHVDRWRTYCRQINQCIPLIYIFLLKSVLFIQESMYKNSQWPECEHHKHFIHNLSEICAFNANLCTISEVNCLFPQFGSREVFANKMPFKYSSHLSADGK